MARRTKGIGKNTILAPNVTKDLSRPHLSRHCQGHYPTKVSKPVIAFAPTVSLPRTYLYAISSWIHWWQRPPKVGFAGKIKGSNLDLDRKIIVSIRRSMLSGARRRQKVTDKVTSKAHLRTPFTRDTALCISG